MLLKDERGARSKKSSDHTAIDEKKDTEKVLCLAKHVST